MSSEQKRQSLKSKRSNSMIPDPVESKNRLTLKQDFLKTFYKKDDGAASFDIKKEDDNIENLSPII